jgi:bisphosphoglycerate-dependent phosphoglycerate mutase
VDVDLSEKGLGEAKGAGELLKAEPCPEFCTGSWRQVETIAQHVYTYIMDLNIYTHTLIHI